MKESNWLRFWGFLVSFLAVLAILFGVIWFVPGLEGVKIRFTDLYYNQFGDKSKNYGGYIGQSMMTKSIELGGDCKVNIKYNNSYKSELVTGITPSLFINIDSTIDKNNPDFKLICLKSNGVIGQFKEGYIKSIQQNPTLLSKLGIDEAKLKSLNNFDFYKLYSIKNSSSCKSQDQLSTIRFVTKPFVDVIEPSFTACSYGANKESEGIQEFYFFDKNGQNVIYIRSSNSQLLDKELLIY